MESRLTALSLLSNFVSFGTAAKGLKDEAYKLVGMINDEGLRSSWKDYKGEWEI
jgi:hypothetical protein